MAAVTSIVTLGGKVCMDSRANELIIVRKADGNIKAGYGVDISAATAVGVDPNANYDEFGGFALPRYDTEPSAAYTAADLIDIVIPQGGHLYNVLIKDPGGTIYAGEPLLWIASTSGALDKGGNCEAEHQARLFDDVLDTTTYATIIWGT